MGEDQVHGGSNQLVCDVNSQPKTAQHPKKCLTSRCFTKSQAALSFLNPRQGLDSSQPGRSVL